MFSMAVHVSRIERLKERMRRMGLDAMLFVKDANLRYFEGYRGTRGFLLVTEGRNYLFADARHSEQAIAECATAKVVPIGPPYPHYRDMIAALCQRHEVTHLGFEGSVLAWEQHKKIKSTLRGVHLVATECLGEWVRARKSEEEVARIREASGIVDRAIRKLLPKLTPGISELRAARELEYLLALEGAEQTAFPTMIAFGARSSHPHSTPQAEITLRQGDLILLDCGACWKGYCSDCSRTFVCGGSTALQRERYALLLQAKEAAEESLQHGFSIGKLHSRMQSLLQHTAYADNEPLRHGLGHGVGLEIHELPLIQEGSATFEKDQVVAIEPGIYFEGWGGMRVEDTYCIDHNGSNQLTCFPSETLYSVAAE